MYPLHHRVRGARRPPGRGGGALSGLLTLLLVAMLVAAALPPPAPGWRPLGPLQPEARPGPFTGWQLARAAGDPALCRAALTRAVGVSAAPAADPGRRPACRIAAPVALTAAGGARVPPVVTDCGVALRLHMWQRHGLQPAAHRHLGAEIDALRHLGSHACRTVRGGTAMSAHATGRAIDIAGVRLADGRGVDVGADGPAERAFWRDARRAACRWFPTVLGPGFDAAHADHLHLAEGRWRACR